MHDPGGIAAPTDETFDPTILAELRGSLDDDEFVLHLVRSFLADTPRRIAALATAVRGGDLEATVATAHRIKGSALTFGAPRLVSLCAAVETGPDRATGLIDSVTQEFNHLSDSLRDYIEDFRPEAPAGGPAVRNCTSRRILVVDDDVLIREVAKMGLELAGGWNVSTATNGAEAVEFALSDPPDVILMDVMMPVMDGPTACRALSEDSATAGIPIILLTARADHEERQGLSTLVAGVLSKPFEPVALSSAIEALLGASDHSGP